MAMLGRIDEAQRLLASAQDRNENVYRVVLIVGRLAGRDRASIRDWLKGVDRGKSKVKTWEVVDAMESALFGTREEANRMAAALDQRPAAGLPLALLVGLCMCGAPFDLDATPNFKARLAESGLPWPPARVMTFPPLPPAPDASGNKR